MNPIRETILAIAVIGVVGCSTPRVADVSDSVKTSLKQQGYNDVSVKDDTQKGVVTLSGKVPSDQDKVAAEGIAKSQAGSQVVADEIAVLPPGAESTARNVNSDLDKGIEENLNAALLQNSLNKEVSFKVKSGVVELTGEVESQSRRNKAQEVAANVPNVQQVVNELQVRNQRASTTTN